MIWMWSLVGSIWLLVVRIEIFGYLILVVGSRRSCLKGYRVRMVYLLRYR